MGESSKLIFDSGEGCLPGTLFFLGLVAVIYFLNGGHNGDKRSVLDTFCTEEAQAFLSGEVNEDSSSQAKKFFENYKTDCINRYISNEKYSTNDLRLMLCRKYPDYRGAPICEMGKE